MMHMEQLDRNIVLSVFSQNDQFQDRRAQRQKHLQIKTITQQVIKAVDDINLTDLQIGMSSKEANIVLFSHQIDWEKTWL